MNGLCSPHPVPIPFANFKWDGMGSQDGTGVGLMNGVQSYGTQKYGNKLIPGSSQEDYIKGPDINGSK